MVEVQAINYSYACTLVFPAPLCNVVATGIVIVAKMIQEFINIVLGEGGGKGEGHICEGYLNIFKKNVDFSMLVPDNLSMTVVVHGKGVEEHDQNLENVIRRLRERNLTLNPD